MAEDEAGERALENAVSVLESMPPHVFTLTTINRFGYSNAVDNTLGTGFSACMAGNFLQSESVIGGYPVSTLSENAEARCNSNVTSMNQNPFDNIDRW